MKTCHNAGVSLFQKGSCPSELNQQSRVSWWFLFMSVVVSTLWHLTRAKVRSKYCHSWFRSATSLVTQNDNFNVHTGVGIWHNQVLAHHHMLTAECIINNSSFFTPAIFIVYTSQTRRSASFNFSCIHDFQILNTRDVLFLCLKCLAPEPWTVCFISYSRLAGNTADTQELNAQRERASDVIQCSAPGGSKLQCLSQVGGLEN